MYNLEILSQMLQPKIRSRDLETQKLQISSLKGIRVISKVAGFIINIKNKKKFNPINLKENLSFALI